MVEAAISAQCSAQRLALLQRSSLERRHTTLQGSDDAWIRLEVVAVGATLALDELRSVFSLTCRSQLTIVIQSNVTTARVLIQVACS